MTKKKKYIEAKVFDIVFSGVKAVAQVADESLYAGLNTFSGKGYPSLKSHVEINKEIDKAKPKSRRR